MRFRAKSLTSLLFAFLLALPMISVISKVIYVQSNKNAYESYYGETINQRQEVYLDNLDELRPDSTYYANYTNTPYTNSGYLRINVSQIVLDSVTYNESSVNFTSASNHYYIEIYQNGSYVTGKQLDNKVVNIELTYITLRSYEGDYDIFLEKLYYYTYNKYSYLDNVFEYAVDEVIEENNFGNIDFFSYFTSIFVSDNQVNNRYIGYVNYYLNYALMVSLAYLLFLMLMWFINFARRFLDRGMNYDW